jgi:NAD+ synthase (glutamine-hydrolysing)
MALTHASAPFGSMDAHGLALVASAVPYARPAEPQFNADRTLALAYRASVDGAALVVFHELVSRPTRR